MRTGKLLIPAACLLMIIAFAAGGAAQGTYTLEEVLSPPYPLHLVSAKDADRIAWVFYNKGERNVWTAGGPDFKPVNLTGYVKDEVFEIPEVHISDDGSLVVYVRGGRPDSRGWVTNPKSEPVAYEQAVWAVKSTGERPWRVAAGRNPVLSPDGQWALIVKDTDIILVSLAEFNAPEPKLLFKAAGRNGNPRWSPDGKRVAFVSNRDDHSFVGVFDIEKQKITWMSPCVDHDSSPRWSADGRHIAFFRRPGSRYEETYDYGQSPEPSIWVADSETGSAKEVWSPPTGEPKFYTVRNLELTKNNRILFTAENDNWKHVYSMPLSGGRVTDLTPGEGFVEHIGLSSDGKTLFFSSNIADIHGRHIWKVPTAGGKAAQLTKDATLGTYPVALASGRHVAFFYSTVSYPLSIALVPARGGKIEVIAPRTLPKEFPIDDLVVPELAIVKSEDGLEIPCQVFLPKGAKPGDGLPGIVYTHGGSRRQMLFGWHYMDFYSDAYGINQYLASKGYVVISINYRSGIGYGRAFRMAENCGRRGGAEYKDVVAGGKYLQSRPEVDSERVGLWGLSYGGLLTALGLARNSDIFKVGVDLAGVHDWSQLGRGRGGMSAEERKVAFESTAASSVDTWKSPVLFIHGDDDRNVPFQQTTDLVQRLRAKGDVHIELMIRPDEPHEFLLYKNRIDSYEATFEFLHRFLKKQ